MKQQQLLFKKSRSKTASFPQVKQKIEKSVAKVEEVHLEEIIDRVKTVLFSAKTLFPLDLFPDDVTVDLERVSVVKRTFFMTEEAITYDVADVYGFSLEHGPLSSTVRLQFSRIRQSEVLIRHLSHTDAMELKKVITGLLKAKKEHIDLTKIKDKSLFEKIEELGNVYA